ncbi:hypothetical protein AALP_AAs50609U000200 [Arabis alpina]|uniref:Uncharacterized protein n=1 Tax=Arabis alpina TaxID=50452 RepID=A0A087FX10_ARAAL|nr:hypothetical protein AALP_AAs50609U000200 [Arabis alpina]
MAKEGRGCRLVRELSLRQQRQRGPRGHLAPRQRLDTYPAVVAERAVLTSRFGTPSVNGLLRDEAYAGTKSKAFEFSLLFDRVVGDYDEDVCSGDNELCEAKEANAVQQSRLDEFAEQNRVLERDALSVQKSKKECDDKLAKVKSRCTKAEDEIFSLRGELSFASDLQSTRIGEADAAARDEMARGFEGRVSEVAGLLAKIGGKAQTNMLDLAEIEANLEFIGLHQGSELPVPPTEIKKLCRQKIPIYDAHVVADDDVEADATDGDDAEVGDNDVVADDDEDRDEEIED